MISENLKNLNITLEKPSIPVANYVNTIIIDDYIYISGQLPRQNGEIITGQLSKNSTKEELEHAQNAAKLCAISILAQLNNICDMEKIKQCIKLNVFVNSSGDFTQHPFVANGASDLIVNVFSKKGKHARSAVGASSLPLGAIVEVDAIFKI